MNFELWEKKRKSSLKEKIVYRKMPGYLMYAIAVKKINRTILKDKDFFFVFFFRVY